MNQLCGPGVDPEAQAKLYHPLRGQRGCATGWASDIKEPLFFGVVMVWGFLWRHTGKTFQIRALLQIHVGQGLGRGRWGHMQIVTRLHSPGQHSPLAGPLS